MKTTNSKDSVKVNQILPIMQEHFGQSMNLARIKLMALLLHALCVVQTVSLHKEHPSGRISPPAGAGLLTFTRQYQSNDGGSTSVPHFDPGLEEVAKSRVAPFSRSAQSIHVLL